MTAPSWLTARPIAHRGLHDREAGRIENSLSAATAAIERGYAIECDVQLSQDGEAMVFHDFTLDRLTGESGAVVERPARALELIGLTGSADGIPSLRRLLGLVAGRVPVVIEIKSPSGGNDPLVRRTIAILQHYRGPVAVKSFDPDAIALVRDLAPDLPRGIVAENADPARTPPGPARERAIARANLLDWPRTEPHFLSWRHQDLPAGPPFLARLLARTPVMTWTVRGPDEAARVRPHADQIVFEGFVPD